MYGHQDALSDSVRIGTYSTFTFKGLATNCSGLYIQTRLHNFTLHILYFVTRSDSCSLVIDCLSANGDPDTPVIQRVFWALTGACTIVGSALFTKYQRLESSGGNVRSGWPP